MSSRVMFVFVCIVVPTNIAKRHRPRHKHTSPQNPHWKHIRNELTEHIMDKIMTTTPHPRARSVSKRRTSQKTTTTKTRNIMNQTSAHLNIKMETHMHARSHNGGTNMFVRAHCFYTKEHDEMIQTHAGHASQSTDMHTHTPDTHQTHK